MQLRFSGSGRAFQHLLDQIDASARAVELVTQQLIGWAGRCAKPAVHAFAQDAFGLGAVRRTLDKVC